MGLLTYQTIREYLAFRKETPPELARIRGVLGRLLEGSREGERPDAASLVSAAEEVVALVGRFRQITPEDEAPSLLMLNAFCPDEEGEAFFLEDHLLNTAALCAYLCLERFGAGQRLVGLVLASLVHDVGMTLLPPDIFSAREEPLAEEEREALRRHSIESASLVASWDEPLASLTDIVAQEHERLDGSGYPHGLRGEEICLEARILGLVDTYEAMTHRRPYKDHQSPHDAMRSLLNVAPRLFGREVFRLAVRRFTMYPMGSYVELSSSERGVVVRPNHDDPMRPSVFVVGGRRNWRGTPPRVVDLREQKLLHIVRCLGSPDFDDTVVY